MKIVQLWLPYDNWTKKLTLKKLKALVRCTKFVIFKKNHKNINIWYIYYNIWYMIYYITIYDDSENSWPKRTKK